MSLLSILIWIVVGAVAGWLAGLVMRGGGFGLLGNILVGIIGAMLGGFLMSFFGKTGVTGFNLYSLLVAVLGAVVLIAILRAIRH